MTTPHLIYYDGEWHLHAINVTLVAGDFRAVWRSPELRKDFKRIAAVTGGVKLREWSAHSIRHIISMVGERGPPR